jgi:hypothetical protein
MAIGLATATVASATRAQSTSGTSAKARYEAAMKRIGVAYAKGIGVIYPLVSGTDGSAARTATIRHLETGSKTLAGVEVALKRTQAPAPVRKLHKRLMADVGKLRLELIGMIASLRSDDVVHFMTLSGLSALPAVNNTIDLIQLNGYKFLGKSTVTAPCSDC